METLHKSSTPKTSQGQVALHLMINQLSVSTLPSAIRHRNILINDIPSELYVNADQHKLAAVLGSLLHTVIGHSNDSYIRISAKKYGNVMLVHFKENNHLNGHAFTASLNHAQKLAESIGGNVTVTSYRNDITTIALSFVNLPVAA